MSMYLVLTAPATVEQNAWRSPPQPDRCILFLVVPSVCNTTGLPSRCALALLEGQKRQLNIWSKQNIHI